MGFGVPDIPEEKPETEKDDKELPYVLTTCNHNEKFYSFPDGLKFATCGKEHEKI